MQCHATLRDMVESLLQLYSLSKADLANIPSLRKEVSTNLDFLLGGGRQKKISRSMQDYIEIAFMQSCFCTNIHKGWDKKRKESCQQNNQANGLG